jgi:formiminotetrahydrofolate cyclodeaminase
MVAPRETMAGLLRQSLGETLEGISREQVPMAGGASAALAGALAAALTAMVARSARHEWVDAGGAIAQAESLRARLCALVASDATAYGRARLLLRRAGQDRERRGIATAPERLREREQRDFGLAEALASAAAEPLAIAEAAADVAALAAWSVEAGGADERADAMVAASLAEAAACAAAQLVVVNLAVRPTDELARRAQAAAQAAVVSRARALAAHEDGTLGV